MTLPQAIQPNGISRGNEVILEWDLDNDKLASKKINLPKAKPIPLPKHLLKMNMTKKNLQRN